MSGAPPADALEPLESLLRRHGLAGLPEEPFPNDGWSGASLTRIRRGDDRFIVKRDSLARDWIAQSTADGPLLREAWFAAHGPSLPSPIRAPSLGAGFDGDGVAILMPDLTDVLFDWETPIDIAALDRVLTGLATLHAHEWTDANLADGPWCPLGERLTLICRASLERPGAAREAVGGRILPGWDAFDRLAPGRAGGVIAALGEDPGPLIAALAGLPSTLIHGDLKLANVGLSPDGSIDLVDWQMVSLAPVAVELGWFLVANVASLPESPIDVLARYRAAVVRQNGQATIGDWPTQIDCAILAGLLLRGWRKGNDAVAGLVHPSGVSAADDLTWWSERAVEAAARIL